MFTTLIVWRKVSIRKCKSGENCSSEQIENRVQVPSDQNINIEAPNEAEKERNVARYMRNKVESNNLGPNNGITDAKNISHMQDRNTIGEINSSNSTTNDLVVGSLNLVGVLLTYLASN